MLGLRIDADSVIIDPVIPYSLNGISASLIFLGHPATFIYYANNGTYNPKSIMINGNAIGFTCEKNNYRDGGAVIPKEYFLSLLTLQENRIEIHL